MVSFRHLCSPTTALKAYPSRCGERDRFYDGAFGVNIEEFRLAVVKYVSGHNLYRSRTCRNFDLAVVGLENAPCLEAGEDEIVALATFDLSEPLTQILPVVGICTKKTDVFGQPT